MTTTLLRVLATAVTEEINPDTEREFILDAQGGDQGAVIFLLAQYAPAIRRRVWDYRNVLDADDARQIAVLAFLQALHNYDPQRNPRFGGILVTYLTKALNDESAPPMVSPRTWRRYLKILKVADGNPSRARIIAPEHFMRTATFDAIHHARDWARWESETELYAPMPVEFEDDAEDRIMVEGAMKVLTPFEKTVIEYAYGFVSDPLSDADIAYELAVRDIGQAAADDGQRTFSRPTIQRTRASALRKMRELLL